MSAGGMAGGELSAGWVAALSEAWDAYLYGSYAIGAVVVDDTGRVIARGRNRLGDPRAAQGGVISGHDLAHAEINALLNLQATPRPDTYGWTVLTTVQPCPQCAGAIAMSGIRTVAYAAPDPWAGCTRLLTDDPYVSKKGFRVGRAPNPVTQAALRLVLVSFLEGEDDPDGPVLSAFRAETDELEVALDLHELGTLRNLRARQAPLSAALGVLVNAQVSPLETA